MSILDTIVCVAIGTIIGHIIYDFLEGSKR